jgi:hypothetical protein
LKTFFVALGKLVLWVLALVATGAVLVLLVQVYRRKRDSWKYKL